MLQSSTIPTLEDASALSNELGWNNCTEEYRFSLGSVVNISEGRGPNGGYDYRRIAKEPNCFIWILSCNGNPQKKSKKHVHLVTPEKPVDTSYNLMKLEAAQEDKIVENSAKGLLVSTEKDTSGAFKANLSEED